MPSASAAALCGEVLDFVQLRTFPSTAQYLSLITELCCAVLLFRISRAEVTKGSISLSRSGPFSAITKAAALWGGLWIAIGCFQLAAEPFVYAVVRHIASGKDRSSPQFAQMLIQNIENLVNVLCLWTTPWLVYRLLKQQVKTESTAAGASMASHPDPA